MNGQVFGPAYMRTGSPAARHQAWRSSLGYSKYNSLLDLDLHDAIDESDDDVDTLSAMLIETNSKARTDAFLRDVRDGKAKAKPDIINELLQDKRPAIRRKLIDALGDLFDMLNYVMSHEQERASKANMLKSMREVAKDVGSSLAMLLNDVDMGVRISAVRSMGKMARYATHNVKRLEDRLKDSASQMRRCLVACLVIVRCSSMRLHGTLDTERDPEAVQLATHILEQRGGQDSTRAVVRLASIGNAVPCSHLLALLRDEDPDVCGAAACAIGQHGPRAAPYACHLLELLRAGDSNMRICATIALRKMGGVAMSQVETLLEDSDHVLRRAAVGVLMTILATTPSSKVLDLAFALVRDAPSEYGAAAAINLVRTGQVRGLELSKLLQDPDMKVRCSAAIALGELGSQAKSYILHLIPLLKDAERHVRDTAIQSVKDIDGYDGFAANSEHDQEVARKSASGSEEAEQFSIMQAYKVYNHLRDAYEDATFQPVTIGTLSATGGRGARAFQPAQRPTIATKFGRKKSWSAIPLPPEGKGVLNDPASSPESNSTNVLAALESAKSPSLSEEVNSAAARRVSQVLMAGQIAEVAAAAATAVGFADARPRGPVRNLNSMLEASDDREHTSRASSASADEMVFIEPSVRASIGPASSSAPGMFSIGGAASRMSIRPQS